MSTGKVLRLPGGTEMSRLDGFGGNAIHRSALAPEVAADDPHRGAVIVDDDGDVAGLDVLVARASSSSARKADWPRAGSRAYDGEIAFRHFLVQDTAAGRHPLQIAGTQHA